MKSEPKAFLVLALLAGLAGCEGIGEGVTLRSLEVQPADGFSSDSRLERPMRAYPCLRDSVELIGTFTDGSKGGFTSRATWRSSNPGAVQVITTDDVPLPEVPTLRLGRGTLLVSEAAAPQTVTITAEFVGLTASMDVAVRPMPPFNVFPDTAHVPVGGRQTLTLLATLDGRGTVVDDSFLRWELDGGALSDDASDSVVAGVASINRTLGHVTGLGKDLGTPLTARAQFVACSAQAAREVRVGEVVSPLTLVHEGGFTDNPGEIVRITSPTGGTNSQNNTSELLKVTGGLDFGGGSPSTATVDLSNQIGLVLDQDLDNNEETSELYVFDSVNRLTAAAKTPAAPSPGITVKAQFTDSRQTTDTADDLLYESGEVVPPVRVEERTLTQIVLKVRCATTDPCVDAAADGTTTTVEGFGTIALEAHGLFTSDTATPATVEQRFTRHVSWRSLDTGLATASANFGATAGSITAQVNPAADAPETVTIEVRSVGAVTDDSKACDDDADPANDDPFCDSATLTITNNPDGPVFCPSYVEACP